MIDIFEYNGDDFKAVFESDGWKIGLLRYSDRFSRLGVWERHLMTDEVFVLLNGNAVLYEKDGDEIRTLDMERGKVYNVPKNVWHHIVVTEDAAVLIVENGNTSKENTERVVINADI